MSNKSKTTTASQAQGTNASNSTAVSTPNVPDWLLNPAQTLAGNISGLTAQGAGAYTPVVSDLQNQSFTGAAGLTSSPYFAQAGGALDSVPNVTAGNVSGQSVLDNLSAYYNPFKSQVLDPTLADFDANAGTTRAAQAAAAARNSAFQGSRYGIQESQTEDALARGRATTEGNLLGGMYTQAAGMSEADAARRQQALLANQSAGLTADTANQNAALQKGQLLSGLGTSAGADARANVAAQAGLGGIQTDQINAARQYPIQYQQQMEQLLAGLNPSDYMGKTIDTTGTGSTTSNTTGSTTQSPSLLSSIGQAAQIASLFM